LYNFCLLVEAKVTITPGLHFLSHLDFETVVLDCDKHDAVSGPAGELPVAEPGHHDCSPEIRTQYVTGLELNMYFTCK
jgi:hypothetical protein